MRYIPYYYDNLVCGGIITVGLIVCIVMITYARRNSLSPNHIINGLIRVVACIAVILAGYTFYVLSRQSAESHDEYICNANLKELGVAVSHYVDSTGKYPSADHWTAEISNYLQPQRASKIFHCPDAKSQFTYAYNSHIANIIQSNVSTPSRLVVIFESDADRPTKIGAVSDVAWDRHVGRVHFLMADGSIQSRRKSGNMDLLWTP